MPKVPVLHKRGGKFVPLIVYRSMDTNLGTTPLSAREREIIAAVARGLSNRDIAAEAGIAQQTVKNHLSSIFQKLQVKSRVQLAVLAIRHGVPERPTGRRPTGPAESAEPASGV